MTVNQRRQATLNRKDISVEIVLKVQETTPEINGTKYLLA